MICQIIHDDTIFWIIYHRSANYSEKLQVASKSRGGKKIAFQNNCQPSKIRGARARGIVTFYSCSCQYQHHIDPPFSNICLCMRIYEYMYTICILYAYMYMYMFMNICIEYMLMYVRQRYICLILCL